MKTLIIQDEFMSDLFISENDGCPITNDLYQFLSRDYRGYNLICDFKNAEEYEIASKENPLWELLLDKFDKISFESDVKSLMFKDEFYNKIGEHNIFLTAIDKSECDQLAKERGYVYLCNDNIIETWKVFMECKAGYKLKVTESNLIPDEFKLNNWDKLNRFSHPLTSIVIFDKYILKNGDLQKVKDNLCQLIKFFSLKATTKKAIQITVITDFKSNEEVQKKYNLLIELLDEMNVVNVSINVVKHRKELYPKNFEGLHSRFILTNYFHISSTDSFNFFKPNKKINNDADVIFTFSLRNHNHYFYCKDISDVKRYLEKLNNDPSCRNPDHVELYYPDKNNYLLN